MNDGELLTYMGTDAMRWAEEFCKLFGVYKVNEVEADNSDQIGLMVTWFANAIEAGRDAGWYQAVLGPSL